MDQNLLMKQRELNDRLNRYRNEYYNLNSPSVSDAVYDRLFEELQDLESATGVQMSNSPTNTVGYPAVSKLEKTNHSIPLLSLEKVKNAEDLCRFMGEHQVMFMLKLDGLTIKLTYEGGKLVEAATRGDGDVGEIVTHNTRAIGGIPENIQYEDRLVVTGEAFIRPSDFEQLKTTLVDSDGKPYKNGRNLAAGSVRLFDAGTCLGRRLMFMPFNVLEGMEELPRKSERLKALRPLGFLPCKYMVTKRPLTQKETEDGKEMLDIRTVSWTRKSPYSFSILRSELQQLEQRPQNRLISGDCGSFAVLRLTQRPGDMKMLEIRFTWLQEIGAGKVHGWQENIRLPYEPFHVFVENGEDMDGAEWHHLSVPEMLMPRYEFHSRKNLHEVARRPVLRRKLGRVLGRHFQWRGTEKIVIYDDGQPYSFFFEEYTPYGRGICGGIILNSAEDLAKAQYSVNT